MSASRFGVAASLSLVLAAACAWAPVARADEKQVCVAAYEKAQQLRNDAKLRAAKDQLVVCSRPECPVIIRQDCAQWMTEVSASLPSVVVAARDGGGHDVIDVRVTVDGVVVAEKLDGKPIPVDPGLHKMKYETRGKPAVEEQVVVREGERNRPLNVTFAPTPGATPLSPPGARPDATPAREAPQDAPSSPVFPIVLVGVGAVALGAALFFDLKGNGDARTLRDVCAPNCKPADVDAVQAKYTAAWVSLGVGVVAVGVGVTMLLLRGSSAPKASAQRWRFDVAPSPGGGAAIVGAEF